MRERADATKPYIGLTSWSNQKTGGKIYKSDAITAKNYLSESEIKALNRLVNMFLDHAERFAETEYSKFRIIQDREYKSDFNKLTETSNNGFPKEANISEIKDLSPFDKSLKRALGYNPRKDEEKKE